MPFVLDYENSWSRPAKRRKLNVSAEMARTISEDDFNPEQEVQNGNSQESQGRKERGSSQEEIRTSDREELIQCIKRGQRPTWVPKPNLEALCAETNAQAKAELQPSKDSSPPLSQQTTEPTLPINLPDPISRPPSALHSGDFHASQDPPGGSPYSQAHLNQFHASQQDLYAASPPPWLKCDPYPRVSQTNLETSTLNTAIQQRQRSRAPSLGSSLSSSFVMRVPTSPLIHATNSPASEQSTDHVSQGSGGATGKSSRRRTMPSHSLLQLSSLISAPSSPTPTLRREVSAPYRTHQVRRSLTTFTYQPATSSQHIFPSRPRRLSHTSETSPRHRSSMIGSFEESILRGRMSTPPSKPLDFVADIGVLGKGNVPAKLKCPAHVSVPFPAVFYSYPASMSMRTLSDDSPSPYVGTIDLETNLKPVEEPTRRKSKAETDDPDALVAEITSPANTSIGRALAAQEESRNLPSSRYSLLGGAYRVPQQGQLQVVIKNPNKTAVKLFLIPYDLEGMQPGSKTFVRQRSFSSGPVLEKALSADPDRTIQDPLSTKQILRYLIHLKFCCLGKGRFYLYDNVRVVFANRVPEGKEKLRNDIQLPEPKYSTLVLGRSSSRRESVSESLPSPSSTTIAEVSDTLDRLPSHSLDGDEPHFACAPIPFHISRTNWQQPSGTDKSEQRGNSDFVQRTLSSGSSTKSTRPQSPEVCGFEKSSTSQRGSPVPWASLGQPISRTSSPAPAATGDGLLSRKLRELSRQNSR